MSRTDLYPNRRVSGPVSIMLVNTCTPPLTAMMNAQRSSMLIHCRSNMLLAFRVTPEGGGTGLWLIMYRGNTGTTSIMHSWSISRVLVITNRVRWLASHGIRRHRLTYSHCEVSRGVLITSCHRYIANIVERRRDAPNDSDCRSDFWWPPLLMTRCCDGCSSGGAASAAVLSKGDLSSSDCGEIMVTDICGLSGCEVGR